MKFSINPSAEQLLAEPYGQHLTIEEDFDGVLMALHQRYAARALEAWAGRNRNVFRLATGYVVKLPRNLNGFVDNDWEGSISNTPESVGSEWYVQYPKTRLGYWQEVPIVFMEFVEALTEDEIIQRLGHEPDWTKSVDCGQVGLTRAGRLVAYDYGLK